MNAHFPLFPFYHRSDMEKSMEFNTEDFELPPLVQSMDRSSTDNSFTLGEILEQNSANNTILSGSAEDFDLLVQPAAEPGGFFGGLFGRVKKVVQNQDDSLDVSQQHSTGSLGESGHMSGQMSSQQLGGAFYVQSCKR